MIYVQMENTGVNIVIFLVGCMLSGAVGALLTLLYGTASGHRQRPRKKDNDMYDNSSPPPSPPPNPKRKVVSGNFNF